MKTTPERPYDVMHGRNQIVTLWAISRNAAMTEARKMGLDAYAAIERMHDYDDTVFCEGNA